MPPDPKALQISARASAGTLTPEQERFNFLTLQIEKLRKSRAEIETNLLGYRQNHAQRLQPWRDSLISTCRDSVFALDRLLDGPGFSRADRAALRDMLCGTIEPILEATPGDAEMKALFDKHSAVSFDEVRQEEFQRLKEEAEAMTGLDLGEDTGIRTEEDLVQRMYEEMAAREAAEESRKDARAQRRRKSAAQRRSEDSLQLAKQSLREIYRKLASAVHPDRELDPQRREAKNALMQKINQAYAANDLLTLFEAQRELELVDGGHLGTFSAERLKQFNKMLSEQLTQLRASIDELQSGFCADHGLPPDSDLNPRKLEQMIRRQAQRVRAELERQKQFLAVLLDKAATKRWLKQQQRGLRELDFEDE